MCNTSGLILNNPPETKLLNWFPFQVNWNLKNITNYPNQLMFTNENELLFQTKFIFSFSPSSKLIISISVEIFLISKVENLLLNENFGFKKAIFKKKRKILIVLITWDENSSFGKRTMTLYLFNTKWSLENHLLKRVRFGNTINCSESDASSWTAGLEL